MKPGREGREDPKELAAQAPVIAANAREDDGAGQSDEQKGSDQDAGDDKPGLHRRFL